MANDSNAQVTVHKLLMDFQDRHLMDKNGRSRASVEAWRAAERAAYHATTGLLRQYRRPRERPHSIYRREMHSMMKRLSEMAKERRSRRMVVNEVLERGERLFEDWCQSLENFRHIHEEKKQEAEEERESNERNERRLGLTPSPPTLHQEPASADEVAAQNAVATEMAGAPSIPELPDGASDFVAPPRRRANSNADTRQPQRRRTSQLTFRASAGGGGGGGNQHRVPPTTRHLDMIDEIDNGNLIASRNMQRLSGILNSRNHSGVQNSQILTNIGSFVQKISADPLFVQQRTRAGEVAMTLLDQIAEDMNANNSNN